MAIDLRRVAATAIETALGADDEPPPERSQRRPRLSGWRGLAAGAALATAAQAAVRGGPGLSGDGRLAEWTYLVRDRVHDRLDEWGLLEEEGFDDEEEPE